MFDYLLYVGRGGWSVEDTAYFISNDGSVKKVERFEITYPELDAKFSKSIRHDVEITENDYQPLQGVDASFGEINQNEIEMPPDKVAGLDGEEVYCFKISNNGAKLLWREEDYGQITILKQLRDLFKAIEMH